MRNGKTRALRALLAALALGGLPALGACNDFLTADNPGAIEEPNLNDPRYINLMVNGVVGEFQPAFPLAAYYTAVFTDELRNHHVFPEERLIDLRQVAPENGTFTSTTYNPLHRARFLADSFAIRMTTVLADSATRDLRLARVYAFGGYAYNLLSEYLCESPINVSRPYTPDELRAFAVERFDKAIAIATAAKAVTGATAATQAAADSLIWMAKVGAARASLNSDLKAQAIAYATGVPDAFVYRTFYSENSTRENNPFFGRFSSGAGGSNTASLFGTPFEAMAGDPRVPRPAATEALQDAGRQFIPNSPSSFSTYSGTAVGAEFVRSGSIRLASGLEARYILAEAQGATTANIAFVESRRTGFGAAAQTGTTATTAANYLANLRDQRARDFYLDGHRLGDLRRYLRVHGVNLFPTGAYPGSTTGETYGSQTCLPLTAAEINGNPNVPRG